MCEREEVKLENGGRECRELQKTTTTCEEVSAFFRALLISFKCNTKVGDGLVKTTRETVEVGVA